MKRIRPHYKNYCDLDKFFLFQTGNFANPVYDSMYTAENGHRSEENAVLLRNLNEDPPLSPHNDAL